MRPRSKLEARPGPTICGGLIGNPRIPASAPSATYRLAIWATVSTAPYGLAHEMRPRS